MGVLYFTLFTNLSANQTKAEISKTCMKEMIKLQKYLAGKPDQERPFKISRYECMYNIKTDLERNIVWECAMHSTNIGKEPAASSYEHGNEYLGSKGGRPFLEATIDHLEIAIIAKKKRNHDRTGQKIR